MTVPKIGLIFMIAPGVYALLAPFWGWISDKVCQVYSIKCSNRLSFNMYSANVTVSDSFINDVIETFRLSRMFFVFVGIFSIIMTSSVAQSYS